MLLYMYVMNRVILLTRFCKLLTTVAILSGGGTCLECFNGTTPLVSSWTSGQWEIRRNYSRLAASVAVPGDDRPAG